MSELEQSLVSRAEFQRDVLGDWEPREGHPVAAVDAEWLDRLLHAFRDGQVLRLKVRDLALQARFDVREYES